MKLTITYLGQPKEITTKFGPKQKNSIKASEHGDTFLSFWVSPQTKDWAVGKEVEVQDVTSREYQGKTYFDIVMPKLDNRPQASSIDAKLLSEIATKIGKVDFKLDQLISALSHIVPKKPAVISGTDIPYPEDESFPTF